MSTSSGGAARILLLGDALSPFVVELARHLKARETVVLGLVSHSAPRDRRQAEEIFDDLYVATPNRGDKQRKPPTILLLLKMIHALWRRRGRYDCLHVHYFASLHALITLAAGRFFRRRIATVYGSDFYHADRIGHMVQKRAFSSVDLVTVTNPEMGRQLRGKYGERGLPPIVTRGFGLTPLAELREMVETASVEAARARFGAPPDAVIVTCAYNRSPTHQHLPILEQLGALPREILDSLFLVLPMTYGSTSPGYVGKIRRRLEEIAVRHLVLTSYMSDREIAELRLATDVLINLPISDQLSGTMQEHMFAGSIVITGSWLPYRVFRELGMEFLEIARIEELAALMPAVLEDLDNLKARTRANRPLIWEMSNWDAKIRRWSDLYREVIGEPSGAHHTSRSS